MLIHYNVLYARAIDADYKEILEWKKRENKVLLELFSRKKQSKSKYQKPVQTRKGMITQVSYKCVWHFKEDNFTSLEKNLILLYKNLNLKIKE